MKKKYPPNSSVSHDEVMIDMLREDPRFAREYLATAIEEATDEVGQRVLLTVMRRISEARGMQKVAKKAGIPRQSLYRALSPKGNPRYDTLMAIFRGLDITLTTVDRT